MKTKLIWLLLLVVFLGCKKKVDEEFYFGTCTAKLNGTEVVFNKCYASRASNRNTDTLSFNFERWQGLIEKESIGFINVLNKIGVRQTVYRGIPGYTYDSTLHSVYGTSQDDGDVTCDFYKIFNPDSLNNFIVITSYNASTGEISGKFSGTYVITNYPKCNPKASDTIKITNAIFNTKLF